MNQIDRFYCYLKRCNVPQDYCRNACVELCVNNPTAKNTTTRDGRKRP